MIIWSEPDSARQTPLSDTIELQWRLQEKYPFTWLLRMKLLNIKHNLTVSIGIGYGPQSISERPGEKRA